MSEHFTNMRSLTASLAEALNLIDPSIENHHQQTAYLAYMIAQAAGYDEALLQQTVSTALVHDIGFITIEKPKGVAEIERQAQRFAQIGANLIAEFPNSGEVADIVRYCQSSWRELTGLAEGAPEKHHTTRVASIVHLADTVSTMLRKDIPILNQVKGIREAVNGLRGTEFSPEAVDAFLRASENEFVWMDLRYNPQFLGFLSARCGLSPSMKPSSSPA